MEELKIFENPEFGSVRTIIKDGEPWFVANDVCKVLEINNSRDAVARLEDDEKNTVVLTDGNRGNPNMTILSESGLYSIIMRSDKPKAKPFRRWVTHDVLPDLRREGVYSIHATVPAVSGKSEREIDAEIMTEKRKTAEMMVGIWDGAGVKKEYQALALGEYLGLSVPALALQAVKVTYDKTTIADKLGILSTAGRPHAQAVGAIISTLNLGEDEVEQVPYYRNGHDGFDVQYAESVLEKVRKWIEQNEYPSTIRVEKKSYKVKYR